jgi:hypothetical protein
MANYKDIKALAELKEKLNPKISILVPKEVLEEVCAYCESNAIYDELGNYGDFYYKIKKLLAE